MHFVSERNDDFPFIILFLYKIVKRLQGGAGDKAVALQYILDSKTKEKKDKAHVV